MLLQSLKLITQRVFLGIIRIDTVVFQLAVWCRSTDSPTYARCHGSSALDGSLRINGVYITLEIRPAFGRRIGCKHCHYDVFWKSAARWGRQR